MKGETEPPGIIEENLLDIWLTVLGIRLANPEAILAPVEARFPNLLTESAAPPAMVKRAERGSPLAKLLVTPAKLDKPWPTKSEAILDGLKVCLNDGELVDEVASAELDGV